LSNAIKNAIVYTHHTVLSPDDFPNILNVPTKQQTPANGYAPDGSENIPKFREAEQNFKKMYFERLWNESVQDIKKISELSGLTPQAVRRILKQLQLR
jgi:DNA-binding NtrC family response regulator